jgi:hypothetical protein
MPVEAMAALLPFAQPPPPPSVLVRDPHRRISGHRHLSRWIGAQLLDSAALRSLAVLDRVITLLHLRAGLALPTRKDGTIQYPGFSLAVMKGLRPHFEGHTAWSDFEGLLQDEYYKLIKRFRDGAVHQRRWPAELHGEPDASYWGLGSGQEGEGPAPERRVGGLDAQSHHALLLATWDQVISRAISLGSQLLEHSIN